MSNKCVANFLIEVIVLNYLVYVQYPSICVMRMSSEQASPSTHQLNLAHIWRGKWLIALVTSLSVAAGVWYVRITPVTYEVQSRVMVREDNPALQGPNAGYIDREFLATQAEIIRSSLIIRKTLEDVSVALPAGYPKGEVDFVLDSLTVTPIVQTDVLKITYRSEDPQVATDLAAALIEKFEEYIQQSDQSRHAGDLELLTRREAELRQQLEKLHDEYTEFRRDSPLIGQGPETLKVQSDQLAHIGRRLSEASNHRIELEKKLETYAAAADWDPAGQADLVLVMRHAVSVDSGDNVSPDSRLGDGDPTVNLLRDAANARWDELTEIQLQQWRAKTRARALEQKYTSNHPSTDLRSARDQVAYWEDLLGQRVKAARLALSHAFEAAKSTESNLQTMYDAECDRVKQLNIYLVEESALTAKIARAEESHAMTLTRYKEYQLTDEALRRGRSSIIVRQLDPDLHAQVIWPKQRIVLAVSALLGLLGGVLLVAFRVSE